MTKKRLWVIAGVLGAGSLAAVPALSAQAYPPGSNLTASASPSGSGTVYNVSLVNGRGGCTVEVQSRGVKAEGRFDAKGTASIPLDLGSKAGNHVITVRTLQCPGPTETATTKVLVTKYKVSGPSTAKPGQKFAVQVSGFSPDLPVVITLTNGNGSTLQSAPLTTNEDGDLTYTTAVPGDGTWTVIATQQGAPSQSFTVTAKGDKVKSPGKPKPKPRHKPKTVHKKTTKPKKKSTTTTKKKTTTKKRTTTTRTTSGTTRH